MCKKGRGVTQGRETRIYGVDRWERDKAGREGQAERLRVGLGSDQAENMRGIAAIALGSKLWDASRVGWQTAKDFHRQC